MSDARWQRLQDLVEAALERPAEARDGFLADACGSDEELRREAASLLAQDDRASGFLAMPVGELAANAVTYSPGTSPAASDSRNLVGSRLGVYEIRARIGAGGMGEVYRAHDHSLHRDVAIKVLPSAFLNDRERLARFEREARLLASLNHPHIGAVYGLEGSGDLRGIVLELIDGETLETRLKRGAIPITQALTLAGQIAGALDHAHRHGVMHRDLKPANIMLTTGGAKLLDFGLAKAVASDRVRELSQSPIVTFSGTHEGVILGTAAYMSPEQARGQTTVDKQTDIWAFGCVLYEMLTGRKAFAGDTVSDHIAAILERDPDWSGLPEAMPQDLRRLLRRCLAKDPTQRLQAIGDARLEIEDLLSDARGESAGARPAHAPPTGRRMVPGAVAVALAGALVLALWTPRPAAPPLMPLRLSVELGANVSLSNAILGTSAVLSPDGSVVAFVGQQPGTSSNHNLYVRRLTALQATLLSGTEGARSPFFSPDGQWIGFFADGELKKVAVTGGATVTLGDAPSSRGGTWGEDDTIVFTPGPPLDLGLRRVSAAGGTAESLGPLVEGEVTQRWPQALPGGKGVLYTSSRDTETYEDATLVVQRLPAGPRKAVFRGGSHGRYLQSGHLVYMHDGTLFAVPFDLDRLEVTGQPVPALDDMMSNGTSGSAQFAVSSSGTMVYLSGRSTGAGIPIHWMNRQGKTTPLRATPANWFDLHFSPDGGRLAMAIIEGLSDIWVYDLARDIPTRVTKDPVNAQAPVWTPDGRRVGFASARADKSTFNLYWQRADGSGAAERLTESNNQQYPGSWHPSGRFLAFYEQHPVTGWDLMILPIEGDDVAGWKPGKPFVFLNSPDTEQGPQFSPDGRWLAYTSRDTGGSEVYVRPFPGPGGKTQISSGGGGYASWSRTKHEIFYGTGAPGGFHIMVAGYSVEGDSLRVEKARRWSEERYSGNRPWRVFDLHPDGERFAIALELQATGSTNQDKVVFIFNFFDELRRIARPR